QRVAHARRVAPDQITLEVAGLLGPDAHVRELPEPGGHAVHRVSSGDGGFDRAAGADDGGKRVRRHGDGRAVAGDGPDVPDTKGVTVQHDRGRHARGSYVQAW